MSQSVYIWDSCCQFLKEDMEEKSCQTKIHPFRQMDAFIWHHKALASGLKGSWHWGESATEAEGAHRVDLGRPGLKWAMSIISVESHLSRMLEVLKVTPFFGWGNWALQKLSDLPMIPPIISAGPKSKPNLPESVAQALASPRFNPPAEELKFSRGKGDSQTDVREELAGWQLCRLSRHQWKVSFRNKKWEHILEEGEMCLACIHRTILQDAPIPPMLEKKTVAGLSLWYQWVSLPPHSAQKGICSKEQPRTRHAPKLSPQLSSTLVPSPLAVPSLRHLILRLLQSRHSACAGHRLHQWCDPGFTSSPNTPLPFGGHTTHTVKRR